MKDLEESICESKSTITTDFQQCEGLITIRSYIGSIITNLLSNAVKFRSPGIPPRIHVHTSIVDNLLCLSVSDNGRGIDLANHGKDLFSIYKKLHNDPIPGKGVGLYLIKAQAEALGGNVEVVSKSNEGAEFKVYFPLSQTQFKK